MFRSIISLIQALTDRIKYLSKQYDEAHEKVEKQTYKLRQCGINECKSENTQSSDQTTVGRRIDSIVNYFALIQTRIHPSVDLTFEFLKFVWDTKDEYYDWFHERFQNAFVRNQNYLQNALQNDYARRANIAFTEVSRLFSQRDSLSTRRAVTFVAAPPAYDAASACTNRCTWSVSNI